jgi:O-antigen/teichoic acid export membrane protein
VAAAAPAAVPARSRLRAVGRDSAVLLSAGTLASGLLAYAFNVVAARALGPADYGPIAVLWAGMFLVSVILFRPIEQTVSRAVAERVARGVDARRVVRSVGLVTSVAAIASALAVLLTWEPISERLFAGQEVLTLALAFGVAGYGASYFVRGIASGLLWFDGYGILLFADGAVRLLLVLPLFIVVSPALAAGAIAAAALGGAVAPLLTRTWRSGLLARLEGRPGPDFELGHALGFAAPAALIAAADQVLVSGGPLLVAITGGAGAAAAAGTVFAATMLVRAPVFLFQGLAASLLPNLTRFETLGDEAGFRRHLAVTISALLGFGAVLTVGALAWGPELMAIMFGDAFEVGRLDLAVLAAGVGCYLASATLSQAALARDIAGKAAVIWLASAATFVALELGLSGSPFHRVSLAFAAAALLNAVLFLALVSRTRPPHG